MKLNQLAPEDKSRELITDLHSALEKALVLIREFQERPPERDQQVGPNGSSEELEALQARLMDAESDLKDITSQLVEAERQRDRIMNLYVATSELHSTLDIREVKATIAEIATDLLGADRYALLVRRLESQDCEVALARKTVGIAGDRFAGERYRGGDPMVDAALKDGRLRTGPEDGSEAVAVVPLNVKGAVVGALVILRLLDHKPSLTVEDRELLDLIAAHAASALFAARVYSTTDRKLRTLESLVDLVRGG